MTTTTVIATALGTSDTLVSNAGSQLGDTNIALQLTATSAGRSLPILTRIYCMTLTRRASAWILNALNDNFQLKSAA